MSDDTALTVVEAQAMAVPTLFGSGEGPRAIVGKATDVADALADVIKRKALYKNISGKSHILVEGWTLLGSMMGVFPVCVWTRRIEASEHTPAGWEARVEARTLSGAVVGAAEASCLRSENNWKNRDDFALRSMAQTRATSKALRLPLGFIVVLAGYEATPADELDNLEPVLRESIKQVQAKKAAAVVVEAPKPPVPFCEVPTCRGRVREYESTAKNQKGRKYWGCSLAYEGMKAGREMSIPETVLRKKYQGHYRAWMDEVSAAVTAEVGASRPEPEPAAPLPNHTPFQGQF